MAERKSTRVFSGFRPQGFKFLSQLARNNEREWFQARKPTFETELLKPIGDLADELALEFARQKMPFRGNRKESLFRIYRDTRFSNDKTLYKTHVCCYLSPSGSKKDQGGVYVHVAPKNCFLASGFWQPESKLLTYFRLAIAERPEAFLKLAKRYSTGKTQWSSGADAEKLKRLPRGFERHAGSEIEEYLKWKSFIVKQEVDDVALTRPDYPKRVAEFAKRAMPFLEWGQPIHDKWYAESGQHLRSGDDE